MKKLIYSVSILAAAAVSAVVFPGCKDDGDDVKPGPAGPSIAFVAGTGFITTDTKMLPMEDTAVKILITHTQAIKSAKITMKVNGGVEADYPDADTTFPNNTTTANWVVRLVSNPAKGDVIEYIINATDKDATTSRVSIKITSVGPLQNYENLMIGHKYGPEKGAFDFVVGDSISAINSPAANRDIIDLSTNTNTFAKSWGTDNGAQFIHSPAANALFNKVYTQLNTDEDLADLWNRYAGNAKSTVSNIADGDLILVKINSGRAGAASPYYLVKPFHVEDDGNVSKNDYIEFDYKH